MDPILLSKIKAALEKKPDGTLKDIADMVGCVVSTVHKAKKLIALQETPEEEKVDNATIEQQIKIQKLQDSNRIERKLFRKEARTLNASNELFEQIIDMLKAITPHKPNPVGSAIAGGTLVVQFSDVHFGETVSLPNNILNTKVLSQRLYKFAQTAITTGLALGCRRAIIALTGDVAANSDRRVDSELMSNEFNRSHAVINAFEIISQAISLVDSYIPVTTIASVLGNEPRVRENLAFEHKSYMDNFDLILHEMLRGYFPSIHVTTFGNPVERILVIDGVHFLITHGIPKAKASPDNQLAYYKAKYGRVDYVISGHLHGSLVAPGYARSGSPIAGNCYSELVLGIANTIPSQSFHLVSDGRVLSFPVDLTAVGEDMFRYTEPPTQIDVTRVLEKV